MLEFDFAFRQPSAGEISHTREQTIHKLEAEMLGLRVDIERGGELQAQATQKLETGIREGRYTMIVANDEVSSIRVPMGPITYGFPEGVIERQSKLACRQEFVQYALGQVRAVLLRLGIDSDQEFHGQKNEDRIVAILEGVYNDSILLQGKAPEQLVEHGNIIDISGRMLRLAMQEGRFEMNPYQSCHQLAEIFAQCVPQGLPQGYLEELKGELKDQYQKTANSLL